jgi:hypothetical protein
MLTALSKHSLIDLDIEASGDTDIDVHHTVEDTAIVLGQAILQALGDKVGIARFGDALVPLDDALARAVVDVSGRPYLVHTGEPEGFEYHAIGGHFTDAKSVDERKVVDIVRKIGGSVPESTDGPPPWLTAYGPGEFVPAGAKPAAALQVKKADDSAIPAIATDAPPPIKIGLAGMLKKQVGVEK